MKMSDHRIGRTLAVGVAVFLLFLAIPNNQASATDGAMNLPSAMVKIEVFNGTESYFSTSLIDVPSGYDVVNGTYPGWCVDTASQMARSPAIHEVTLYSSINPPGTLANESWDMVNYILNHKNGTAEDVQQAIWYFVNMDTGYTPSTNGAWAMINDTLLNGHGYVPANGQITGVICLPKVLLPQPNSVQISIIELAYPPIPEFPLSTVSILLTLTTILVVIIHKKRNLLMRR